MSEHWRFILVPFCFLAGCANIPDSYAPPVQRQPLTPTSADGVGHFANMGDSDADLYIVGDVTGAAEAGAWRWARKRPSLRFYLDTVEHIAFTVDFTVADVTFKETGPVRISVFINDNLLETIDCPAPGERHFVKPVPARFLRAKAVNFVRMEIDKVWVAKTDGAVLGFILTRAGFTQ